MAPSNVTLNLALAEEGPPPRIGELVVVVVTIHTPAPHDDCTLTVNARLRGWRPGSTFGGYDEPECVTAIDLEAGTTEVEVELPPLGGPATYVGEQLAVRWFIVAELRDGRGVSLESTDLQIDVDRRDRDADTEMISGGYRDVPRRVVRDVGAACGTRHVEGPRVGPHPHRHIDAQLDAAPSRLEGGTPIDVKLWLYFKAALRLDGAVVMLVRNEGLRHALGDGLSAVVAEQRLTGPAKLEPGHHAYTTRVVLPPDAATSYADDAFFIEWALRAVLTIDARPYVVREYVLGVL